MSELTYPERLRGLSIPLARGVTYASGPWHILVEARVIGMGEMDFHRAARRIGSWQMHRDTGVKVKADSVVGKGSAATMRIGVGMLSVTAECVVVAVVDEPREFGFAYGTLARHPECGEEAFLVSWREDGAVVGSVAAFSQPARWYTKAGGPVTRAGQALAARRYLSAMLR